MDKPKRQKKHAPTEIAVIGEVDSWEEDVVEALLESPPQRECTFFIDSAGGSVFGALAVITLMRHRQLEGTAIVIGECSSAAILLFAACRKRFVTPHSVLLFHRMRWQSDKRVAAEEALLWAKHFGEMEKDIDDLQARLFGTGRELVQKWISEGQYITGKQVVEAGLAELMTI